MILDKIESLLAEVKEMKASNAEEIEALRLKYLSKKGEINAVMADFRNVPADQKKEVGMKINELKQTALERLNALRDAIETSEDGDQGLDLTRTAYPIKLGTRHPLTIVKNEIIDIFSHEDEFRRRPSCPRHAGHILHRAESKRCYEEHPSS